MLKYTIALYLIICLQRTSSETVLKDIQLQALQACNRSSPLGMINGDIQDWQISASSTSPQEWDRGCHERFARLYHPKGRSWCSKYKAPSEWLQVDLGVASKVTGLMTQGRGNGKEWVTAFMVSYSLDAFDWKYVEDSYGNQRVFEGNSDSDTVKHSYLEEPVITRFIRFQTVHWNQHPSMRVEVVGCQPCRVPVALPPYAKISASSEKHQNKSDTDSCHPDDGYIVTNKAWCARASNDEQWLQFDVGPATLITGMVTRGRGDSGRKQWVTRFRLSYSNGSDVWIYYKDAAHLSPKEFGGNVDKDIERIHYLNSPFIARFIRFHPIDWNRHISMRAGLFGCPFTGKCTTGFMRINEYTPCVANLALHRESFVSNKRQQKRHVRTQWTRGQAARAVDGDQDSSLHTCTLMDNFYVEKPIWMVDIGTRTKISGAVIVTWQNQVQGVVDTPTASYRDYTHNLERLTIYVDNKAGTEALDVPGKMCGFVSRLNGALFRRRLYVQCVRPLVGRYLYVEAMGLAQRTTRLFSAVLCEVMIYE